MKKGTILQIRSLRQRWVLNTVLPVTVMLTALLSMFIAGCVSYYYSGLRTHLENKARVTYELFTQYAANSYAEYYQLAIYYTKNFEDKDRLEMQFLNTAGAVQVSAYGLAVGLHPDTPDIASALSSGELSSYRGHDAQTGESILAVSVPMEFDGRLVGVMRFVTSMQAVNRELLMILTFSILIAILCITLVIVSNLIFIRHVVQPVAEVTQAAKRISQGSYGIQLENHYGDEMGELIDNINDMSRQISQSERMKSEFIASVSHELRTPLTAITGWGETLLDDPQEREQLERGLHIIVKESRRLSTMVEELLEFSKLEDGRFTLQLETVDLQAELEDAVFTYRTLFRQEGISVEYTTEEDGTVTAIADPERLKQVFSNLLDNAAKHGGTGGRVCIHFSRSAEFACITIRDYGTGIPENELPFVKQKFYKGSSRVRGNGIGLAVCDEIITRHGGTLTIANAKGGGVIATIQLPLEEK